MKTIILLLSLILSTAATAQPVIDWSYSADGPSTNWNQWDYKDVIIPEGFTVDSIFGGFVRPSVAPEHEDFICHFNQGQVYDNLTALGLINYSATDSSLYGYWIPIDSVFIGPGVIRVGIAVPSTSFDSLGVAMSKPEAQSTAGINYKEIVRLKVHPNPATSQITIENATALQIVSASGYSVYENLSPSDKLTIDISSFNLGVYFIREENRITKFIKQ